MEKYFLIFLSFFIYACNDNVQEGSLQSNSHAAIDSMTFVSTGYNNGQVLHLLHNDQFIYEQYAYSCFFGGERKTVSGQFQMNDTSLQLIPDTVSILTIPRDIKYTPEEITKGYDPDSLNIKTSFRIVRWNDNTYLLSDMNEMDWNGEEVNDFLKFADCYNAGIEPKLHGLYLVADKKLNEVASEDLDRSQIPEQWRKYFLTSPIAARIVSIEKTIDKEDSEIFYWMITLDKGSDENVRKGMSFQSETGEVILDIDSVSQHGCTGIVSKYEVGDKDALLGTVLQTKWE